MTPTESGGSRPLVTVLGASGFVGSAVTTALARRPIRLRAVARRPVVVPEGCQADVDVRTADLTVARQLDDAIAGSDAVIHLVVHSAGWREADRDADSEQANVGVMVGLVESVRRRHPGRPAPVVIFAGSCSQVGQAPGPVIDGTEPDHPESVFDRQKQAAECALKAASARGVLRGISLRLPTVYGLSPAAGLTGRGVITAMVRRALAGQPLTMWHDGSVRRDLLHVRDAAAGFTAALDHADALAGEHYVLGTGEGARLGDVFRAIAEAVSAHTGEPVVPVESVPAPVEVAASDLRSVTINPAAFASATGWCARVRLGDALPELVAALAAPRARKGIST